MKTLAVYPGSFDPLTWGHLDLIERARKMFDVVVVAVLANADKQPLFTAEERVALLRGVVGRRAGIRVESFDGLLVDYARAKGATAIIRGLRAISDFEFEFQMALMNRHLAPEVETVFLMPKQDYTYISSRIVKQVAALGGKLTGLVPPRVEKELRRKFRKKEG
jgi:pantetheine-phosphate adenylyltransferase